MPGNKDKVILQIKDVFQVEIPLLPSVIPLSSKADHKGVDYGGLKIHYHQQLSSNQLRKIKHKHAPVSHLPLHPIHEGSLIPPLMRAN